MNIFRPIIDGIRYVGHLCQRFLYSIPIIGGILYRVFSNDSLASNPMDEPDNGSFLARLVRPINQLLVTMPILGPLFFAKILGYETWSTAEERYTPNMRERWQAFMDRTLSRFTESADNNDVDESASNLGIGWYDRIVFLMGYWIPFRKQEDTFTNEVSALDSLFYWCTTWWHDPGMRLRVFVCTLTPLLVIAWLYTGSMETIGLGTRAGTNGQSAIAGSNAKPQLGSKDLVDRYAELENDKYSVTAMDRLVILSERIDIAKKLRNENDPRGTEFLLDSSIELLLVCFGANVGIPDEAIQHLQIDNDSLENERITQLQSFADVLVRLATYSNTNKDWPELEIAVQSALSELPHDDRNWIKIQLLRNVANETTYFKQPNQIEKFTSDWLVEYAAKK